MTDDISCALCAHSQLKLILEQDHWAIYRCMNCRFVFKSGNSFHYENLPGEYFSKYNFDRSKEVDEIIRILNKLFQNLEGINLIEIGSGTGSLLSGFKKYGINVYGFEPSKSAVAIAKSVFGLSTITNGYFAADKIHVEPNVFLLYDVIEHLADPIALFQEFRRSMPSNSFLIVKSGNPSSLNARLYPSKWIYFLMNEHVAFYDEKSLSVLCGKTGLRVEKFFCFKDAYGGVKGYLLLKNVVKAFLLWVLPKKSRLWNRVSIYTANDHFIAVIRHAV